MTSTSSIQPTKVSVIVPLYYCDPSLFLPINNCLMALQEHYPEFELIVIDDHSPLEIYHQWPITSYNESNLGFTKTVNRGLFLANGDVLLVINDDITVHRGQLDDALHFNPLETTIGIFPDTAATAGDYFGACWAMTRATYELLGPLNEHYRNFFSDTDYHDRALEAGVKIVTFDDIVLDHAESSTFKLLDKEALLNDDLKRYYGE